MAVNMSEFVPDNNLNWLALAACVYGNISAGRALCCLGLVGTKPKRGYKRASELDGNSLLKMHQAGMSLRSISAKLDLYCPFSVTIPADSKRQIPLGVAVEIPQNHMGLLTPRSSMSKTPLRCANSVGIIDEDYRGEISIVYENVSCKDYTIARGDRIAQLIIVPIKLVDVVEVDELSETERGAGGYGSTGK